MFCLILTWKSRDLKKLEKEKKIDVELFMATKNNFHIWNRKFSSYANKELEVTIKCHSKKKKKPLQTHPKTINEPQNP